MLHLFRDLYLHISHFMKYFACIMLALMTTVIPVLSVTNCTDHNANFKKEEIFKNILFLPIHLQCRQQTQVIY